MLQFVSICSQGIQFWRIASFDQSQKLRFACNCSQELKFGREPCQLEPGAQAAACCGKDLELILKNLKFPVSAMDELLTP